MFDSMLEDLSLPIFGVVLLIILWALTERWRIEFSAKRKRARQNKQPPGAA